MISFNPQNEVGKVAYSQPVHLVGGYVQQMGEISKVLHTQFAYVASVQSLLVICGKFSYSFSFGSALASSLLAAFSASTAS